MHQQAPFHSGKSYDYSSINYLTGLLPWLQIAYWLISTFNT